MARQVVGLAALPSFEIRGPEPTAAPGETEQLQLDRQGEQIRAYCRERRWRLLDVYEGTVVPGRGKRATAKTSQGLRAGMTEIKARRATGLVVDRLDRLSFFAADIRRVFEWLAAHDAILVAINERLDTSRPGGESSADAFLRGAEWERATRGTRIRIGQARSRMTAPDSSWNQYASRLADRPEVIAYIHRLREEGLVMGKIASRLNDESVPTARGGRYWWPSTVASALRYPRRS